MFRGGLPASLQFGSQGISSPTNVPTTTNPPNSQSSTSGQNVQSADPNNYAGVFAQMLNMMSNQNIVRTKLTDYFCRMLLFRMNRQINVMQSNWSSWFPWVLPIVKQIFEVT